jgi:hypothetical protein
MNHSGIVAVKADQVEEDLVPDEITDEALESAAGVDKPAISEFGTACCPVSCYHG